jgi:hypothetical protein
MVTVNKEDLGDCHLLLRVEEMAGLMRQRNPRYHLWLIFICFVIHGTRNWKSRVAERTSHS